MQLDNGQQDTGQGLVIQLVVLIWREFNNANGKGGVAAFELARLAEANTCLGTYRNIVATEKNISRHYCTRKLRTDYAHIGLYDVLQQQLWVAKKRFGVDPIRAGHAQLFAGTKHEMHVVERGRFIYYWFYTPGTGSGFIRGYPIEWKEGHLLVKLDPVWDHRVSRPIRATDMSKIERNVDQQYEWGQQIFAAYTALKPRFSLSWHLIGPRPTDSMFYIQRVEGAGGIR